MKCFVIQPFSEPYNKRYDDTFAGAINAAGFEPYRVDQDPSASIPIDEIEAGIKSSVCCFVDISEDNPNVWFELGYAIASKKQLCIVCSDGRREKFPFDIQHRSVIKYSTSSASDFAKLEQSITQRLKAISAQIRIEDKLAVVSSPVAVAQGELDHYEFSCLALVAGETLTIEETVSISRIRDAMERAGFTAPATALAIHELKKTGLIEVHQGQDWNGNDYLTCQMTNDGFSKLKSLSSKIALVQEAVPKKPQAPRGRGPRESFSADLDDEIPF